MKYPPYIRARRQRRLGKIAKAQERVESALLTLRRAAKPGGIIAKLSNSAFGDLYYLMRLAKRAPWGGGPVQ